MSGAALLLAVSVASSIFPKWEKVSVEEMTKPVPAFDYQVVSLGSVGRPIRSEKLDVACQITEAGKVVGYRLSCK